jgi:hypothetical protein
MFEIISSRSVAILAQVRYTVLLKRHFGVGFSRFATPCSPWLAWVVLMLVLLAMGVLLAAVALLLLGLVATLEAVGTAMNAASTTTRGTLMPANCAALAGNSASAPDTSLNVQPPRPPLPLAALLMDSRSQRKLPALLSLARRMPLRSRDLDTSALRLLLDSLLPLILKPLLPPMPPHPSLSLMHRLPTPSSASWMGWLPNRGLCRLPSRACRQPVWTRAAPRWLPSLPRLPCSNKTWLLSVSKGLLLCPRLCLLTGRFAIAINRWQKQKKRPDACKN